MYEQLDIFSFLPQEKPKFNPGDWVEKDVVGEELTFDEIVQLIGNLIVMDKSTSAHEWYKVVRVEKIVVVGGNQRRLVYSDGTRQNGLVNEMYFNADMQHPARAYRITQ